MRFLIRNRDGKYPALFDDVLADAGIRVVLTGDRIPRMKRWIHNCRRELLDRTHLEPATRYASTSSSTTPTPHQDIANARPLQPLPHPTTDQAAVTRLDIRRRQRLGGILHEYHHAA